MAQNNSSGSRPDWPAPGHGLWKPHRFFKAQMKCHLLPLGVPKPLTGPQDPRLLGATSVTRCACTPFPAAALAPRGTPGTQWALGRSRARGWQSKSSAALLPEWPSPACQGRGHLALQGPAGRAPSPRRASQTPPPAPEAGLPAREDYTSQRSQGTAKTLGFDSRRHKSFRLASRPGSWELDYGGLTSKRSRSRSEPLPLTPLPTGREALQPSRC